MSFEDWLGHMSAQNKPLNMLGKTDQMFLMKTKQRKPREPLNDRTLATADVVRSIDGEPDPIRGGDGLWLDYNGIDTILDLNAMVRRANRAKFGPAKPTS